jgi:hypothetical protein
VEAPHWEFATTISVSEVLGGMSYAPVPAEVATPIRTAKIKRLVAQLNDGEPWSCALGTAAAGEFMIMVSKARLDDLGLRVGSMAQMRLVPDESRYGMPVPPLLAEVFEFDPDLETAFQRLLPGRQRNHLHQIGQAKSEETAAKRIAALLRELGH